jgi:hypothetical protein
VFRGGCHIDALPVGWRKQGGADLSAFWRVRILDAGDVEEGGGDDVSDEDAKDDDGDGDFVDHRSLRVNGNALMVRAAVQIVLKISSNVSGEKIKPHWGADVGLLSFFERLT